jgi:hypothetical protein
MTAAAAILVALALAGVSPSGPPVPAPSQWERLYEASGKDQWFAAVWLKADGSWRAGGRDLIVSGDRTGVRTTPIDGFVVYAFGEDTSGDVVAVGSRQAVWEERGKMFERVHERPGPPRTGRAAHNDVLEGVRYLDPGRPERLVAYGSLHLTVSKEPNKPWRADEDDNLAQRGSLGPEPKPPAGCHPAGWHWTDSNDGILDCHEGTAYLYSGPTPTSLARLPRPCGTSMRAVRDGSSVVVACGEKAQIWRKATGEKAAWSLVPGVTDVQALQARGGCLLVATTRTIMRRCAEVPAK